MAAATATLDDPNPATVDVARQRLADELADALKRGESAARRAEAELLPLKAKLADAIKARDAAAKAVAEAEGRYQTTVLLHDRAAEHARAMLRRSAPPAIAAARREFEAMHQKLCETGNWSGAEYQAAQRKCRAIFDARGELDRLELEVLSPADLEARIDAIRDGIEEAGRVQRAPVPRPAPFTPPVDDDTDD